MKNRNIKVYDVNLISMERSIIFCFKTTDVSIYFVLRIHRVLFIFFMFLHPLEKELPVNPLHLSVRGGGGGYGYFLEPHIFIIVTKMEIKVYCF